MKRGEVWWYEHPYLKRRPAVIMTRDEAIDKSYLTSRITTLGRERMNEVCKALNYATSC
jgi:mRNA-degrading endonuclease toxin of MazEF toxin-antitoxin module